MQQPATIYARFSSQEQGKGSSVARQTKDCGDLALKNDWQVVHTIIDEGRSAFAGSNRAEGGALFEFERQAKAGLYANGHVLICEHLDRITRQGWQQALEFLTTMTACGVTVATVDGSRIFSPRQRIEMGAVMEIILKSELAWEESNKKSGRIAKAWSNRLDKLRGGDTKAITAQVPAWMTVENGKVVLIEERAAVLREMFELSAGGFGGPAIVKRLNDRGERTWGRSKKGWQLGYVTRLLTTRAAVGEFEPMKRARHVTLATTKGERFLDYYPAAIDLDLFNRVQEARAGRRGTGGKRGYMQANIFSGIATCDHCGGRMTFSSTRKAGDVVKGTSGSRKPIQIVVKEDYTFLQCDNAKRRVRNAQGELCPNRVKVRYERLEPAVLGVVMRLAFDETSFAKADEAALVRNEIAEAERQQTDKRKRLDTLVDSFSRTGSAAVERAMLALETEIAADDANLVDLNTKLTRAMGSVSPDEHIKRVMEIRDAMTDDNLSVRLEARVRVHQALKGIITLMTCDAEKITTIGILDALMSFRFDGEGVLIWAHDARFWKVDGTEDHVSVRALRTPDKAAIVDAVIARSDR